MAFPLELITSISNSLPSASQLQASTLRTAFSNSISGISDQMSLLDNSDSNPKRYHPVYPIGVGIEVDLSLNPNQNKWIALSGDRAVYFRNDNGTQLYVGYKFNLADKQCPPANVFARDNNLDVYHRWPSIDKDGSAVISITDSGITNYYFPVTTSITSINLTTEVQLDFVM